MRESDKVMAQSDNDVQENIQVEINENTIEEFMRKSYWNEEYLFYKVDQYSGVFREDLMGFGLILTILLNSIVLLLAGAESVSTGTNIGLFYGWLRFLFLCLSCFLVVNIIHVTCFFEKGKNTCWGLSKNYWANALPLFIFIMFSFLLYPIMSVVSHFINGWHEKVITDLNANNTKPYSRLFNLTKRWTTSKMRDGFYQQFNLHGTEHMVKIICLYMLLRKHGTHHLTERQMFNHWRELSKQLRRSTSKIEDPKIWLDLTPVSNMKEEVVSSNTVISLGNADNHFMESISLQHLSIPLQY